MPPRISVAPVCPISRDQALPGMPGAYRPFVPRALDLASAIVAANNLALLLAPMAGLSAVGNGGNGLGAPLMGPGQSGPNQDGGGSKKKQKRWIEKDRKTCKIKYHALLPNGKKDPINFVVMERITYLKFFDKVQKVDFEFDWHYNESEQFEMNGTFISGDKGRSEYEQFRARAFRND